MTRFVWPVVFGAAVLVGMWITERRSEDRSLARKTFLLGVWGGILGARLWFSAQYGLWSAGMSVWGFLFGAVLAVSLYRRFHFGRWQTGDFADAVTPAVLVASAVMRVGCFLRGCCYGQISTLPWAVTYGPSDPAYQRQIEQGLIDRFSSSSLPVHPTQLYEAIFDLGLAFLLTRRALRLPRHFGLLVAATSYAVFRFLLEFVRGDSGGRHFGPLTFAQVTSLAILLISLPVIWWRVSALDRATAPTGGNAG